MKPSNFCLGKYRSAEGPENYLWHESVCTCNSNEKYPDVGSFPLTDKLHLKLIEPKLLVTDPFFYYFYFCAHFAGSSGENKKKNALVNVGRPTEQKKKSIFQPPTFCLYFQQFDFVYLFRQVQLNKTGRNQRRFCSLVFFNFLSPLLILENDVI